MSKNMQLVTLEEAKRIAEMLGDIGGGVLPYNESNPDKSGIYIPQYGGPFAPPSQGEQKFYHFRFRNGAQGNNAGLVKGIMAMFPTCWTDIIAAEVDAAAKR
jgi:hypothetical protein